MTDSPDLSVVGSKGARPARAELRTIGTVRRSAKVRWQVVVFVAMPDSPDSPDSNAGLSG